MPASSSSDFSVKPLHGQSGSSSALPFSSSSSQVVLLTFFSKTRRHGSEKESRSRAATMSFTFARTRTSLNSFAQSGLNLAISNHFVTLRGGMTDARVPLDFFRWSQSEGNGLIHSHSLDNRRSVYSLSHSYVLGKARKLTPPLSAALRSQKLRHRVFTLQSNLHFCKHRV